MSSIFRGVLECEDMAPLIARYISTHVVLAGEDVMHRFPRPPVVLLLNRATRRLYTRLLINTAIMHITIPCPRPFAKQTITYVLVLHPYICPLRSPGNKLELPYRWYVETSLLGRMSANIPFQLLWHLSVTSYPGFRQWAILEDLRHILGHAYDGSTTGYDMEQLLALLELGTRIGDLYDAIIRPIAPAMVHTMRSFSAFEKAHLRASARAMGFRFRARIANK